MIYYTADLHVHYAQLLPSRPFATVEEMDEALVKNWNDTVGPEDTVYLVGDIGWNGGRVPGELLERLSVSAIALPDVEEDSPLRREILTLAEEKGIPLWWVRRDTTVELEKGQLTLYPPLGAGEANELGLSVLAGAGGLDLLVTGDMSGDVEGMLVEHAGLRDVELLVAGHHGSATSTTQALLNALQPETAILSVGRDNAYGHPAPETLERLERAGAEIYRTDRDGTVTVRTR